MGFPLSFLAGLAVLLMHEQLDQTLPGAESVTALVFSLGAIAVPWLLARTTARVLGRTVLGGGVPSRRLLLTMRPATRRRARCATH